MAEQINLTSPDQATPGTSDYRVVLLAFAFEDAADARISISLRGTNGVRRSFTYEGAEAVTLMTALNKANLSTKSLQRRVLERLISDGHLAGTIAGAPE